MKDRVLITGAAQGIGRSTALAFSLEGCDVALADIDQEGMAKVHAEVARNGGRAIAIGVDLRDRVAIDQMVDTAIDGLGRVDTVVCNAGVAVAGPADITPLEDWEWIIDINLWANVHIVRKVLPYFRSQGHGQFVFMSSAVGLIGAPELPAYCTTKFALYGLAESLASSLGGTNIFVSVVCPSLVNTDIVSRTRFNPDPDWNTEVSTAKRMGKLLHEEAGLPPERVAAAIVEGVKARKFLVLPHPEVLLLAQGKFRAIDTYLARAGELAHYGRLALSQNRPDEDLQRVRRRMRKFALLSNTTDSQLTN